MGCSFFHALCVNISPWLFNNLYSQIFLFHSLSHIPDDFMFNSRRSSPLRESQLQCFLKIAHFAGIPFKESKMVQRTTQLLVHGIEIDTVARQAHLPSD